MKCVFVVFKSSGVSHSLIFAVIRCTLLIRTRGSSQYKKMSSYQYRNHHVKDTTVLFLTWEYPYLGKTGFILRQGPDRLNVTLSLRGSRGCILCRHMGLHTIYFILDSLRRPNYIYIFETKRHYWSMTLIQRSWPNTPLELGYRWVIAYRTKL